LLSGSTSGVLQTWDITTGKHLSDLTGHRDEIRCLDVHEDICVTGGYDAFVILWNVEEDKKIAQYTHTVDVFSVQYAPPYIFGSSASALIRVWDIETQKVVRDISGHSQTLRAIRYDKESQILVSAGEDSQIKIWDMRTHTCVAEKSDAHSSGISCLQFDSEKILTGSFDASVKMWDMKTFTVRQEYQVPKDEEYLQKYYFYTPHTVWDLQYDDSKLVTAHASQSTKVWDLESGKCLATIKGHSGEVICLNFDETTLITGSEDRCIRVHSF
jgi:WD40 repeat protein